MSTSAISNSDAINNDAVQRANQLNSSSEQQHGLKRPSSDDLNLQAIKKSNGADMATMGMGAPLGAGLLSDSMEVPENAVGLVIGRGGEQISNIQSQSGCRVQLNSETSHTGNRQCTLQGSPQAIERARQLINEIISRAQANNPNGMNPQFVTQQLLIPGNKCGLIIGKNGETIKSMQESIGVKMLLIQENQHSGAQPKPLRISGLPEKVEQAKRAVELLLANDDANGRTGGGTTGMPSQNAAMMGGTRSLGEVIVPRSSVGIIIGKQGETIKRLATETGTKIQFKPDTNTSTPERCCVIQGTPQQIEQATRMIWDLVQRSNGNAQQEVCLMHVPANKTGLVIGKGGETIKALCAETSAHIELSREAPPNAQEKVFVIKGTPYQIHMAQHMIRIKVGDLAPGTPVPPFQNMTISGGFQQPNFGGAGGDFNPQWAASNGFPKVANQDPNWSNNPYMGGQQQGGFVGSGQPQYNPQGYQQPGGQQPLMQVGGGGVPQAQAQAAAAPAQNAQSSQPTINPATGQPDYSQQWIAYYRSVGLFDQANLIEQQMKAGKQ